MKGSRQRIYAPTLLSLVIPRAGFSSSLAAIHCYHCLTASSATLVYLFLTHLLQEVRRKDGEMWFNVFL